MTVPFAVVITPDSLVFTVPTGDTHYVARGDGVFVAAQRLLRTISVLQASDRLTETAAALANKIAELVTLVTPDALLQSQGIGYVTVHAGVVRYDGEPVHSRLSERILWGLREGFNMQAYLAFMDHLLQNPSKRVVDSLLSFIERRQLSITPDGYVLGYRRVRSDFTDLATGTIDHTPRQFVSMARNDVNDDPQQPCRRGLRVCAQRDLPPQARLVGTTSRIVIVKVNPQDFVVVPTEHDATTARVCCYEVIREYRPTDSRDGPDRQAAIAAYPQGINAMASSLTESDERLPIEGWTRLDDWGGDMICETNSIDPVDQSDQSEFDGFAPATALAPCDGYDPAVDDSDPVRHKAALASVADGLVDSDEAAYFRGFEQGYAKGLFDASDAAVEFMEKPTGLIDPFAKGYVAGWDGGMREGRLDLSSAVADASPAVPAETTPAAVISPNAIPAGTIPKGMIPADATTVDTRPEIPMSEIPVPEVPMPDVPMVEREVRLPRAEPVPDDLDPHAGLRFDQLTGQFKVIHG